MCLVCLTGTGSGFVAWLVGRLVCGSGSGSGDLCCGPADADACQMLLARCGCRGGCRVRSVVQARVRVRRGSGRVCTLETTRVKHARGRGGIRAFILMTTFALLHTILQVR